MTDTVETATIAPGPVERPARPPARRWVLALTMVLLLLLGFTGGVAAAQYLAPRTDDRVLLVGTAESVADGLVTVRTETGEVVPVRLTPRTRTLGTPPGVAAPPPATSSALAVQAVRDVDGAYTAEVVLPR